MRSGVKPRIDAAEGWGGDAFTVYERDENTRLLHLETVWDSPEDAGDFFQSLRVALGNRGGTNNVTDVAPASRTRGQDVACGAKRRQGDDCGVGGRGRGGRCGGAVGDALNAYDG